MAAKKSRKGKKSQKKTTQRKVKVDDLQPKEDPSGGALLNQFPKVELSYHKISANTIGGALSPDKLFNKSRPIK